MGCGSSSIGPLPCGDGARFDGVAWHQLPRRNSPPATAGHSAVWTGKYMVIWGGSSQRGALYDPASDEWYPTTLAGAPAARGGHNAVWAGDRMLVQGGVYPADEGVTWRDGGQYVPGM